MNKPRKVRRCLVMIDYGEGDAANGEVFDLTELVAEISPRTDYGANIELRIDSNTDYDGEIVAGRRPWKYSISFSGHALGGQFISGATHLDDVVNGMMPDGFKVQDIRKKATRLRKKADQLDRDAMVAKLEQVAALRHQYPIARFTEPLPLLAAVKQEIGP